MNLPKPDFAAPTVYEYTADQMRAAILEERERCAAILENALPTDGRSVNWSSEDRVMDEVLRTLLDDIRKGAE